MVVTPLAERPTGSCSIVVGEMVDAVPPEAPSDERPRAAVLEKLREFLAGDLKDVGEKERIGITSMRAAKRNWPCEARLGSSDTLLAPGNIALTGKVLAYRRGSRLARYFLGFGLGKSEVLVQLRLREPGRAQDLFVGHFRGEVGGGFAGGSEFGALRAVSVNFAEWLRDRWR